MGKVVNINTARRVKQKGEPVAETSKERLTRIKASIKRIDTLMAELKAMITSREKKTTTGD